jgi:hypothetical protein
MMDRFSLEEKQAAFTQISKAISQAQFNMGLKPKDDQFHDIDLAKAIIESSFEIRKNPQIADITEAIRLFSIGVIKFESQLHVLSVANVIRSYKFYVETYQPEKNIDQKLLQTIVPVSHQLPSAQPAINNQARRELLETYLKDMNGLFEGYFQKAFDLMIEIGAINPTTEEKTEMYRTICKDIIENERYPSEFMFNSLKRKDIWFFKDYLAMGEWPELRLVQNNEFHKYLVKNSKQRFIKKAIANGIDSVLQKFDTHFNNKV